MRSLEDRINIEHRISMNEQSVSSIHDEIREIKSTLRWLIGLIVTMNSAIAGILAKGFDIL